MNKLSYKIKIDERPNFYPNIFKIVIDGRDTDYFFDVAGLEISRSESGVIPMFVCGCGYIMCTGYYVKIEILDNEIIWSKFYYTSFDYENPEQNEEVDRVELIKNFDGKRADFIISPPLKFDKKEYNKMIDDILKEVPQHKEQQAEFENSLEFYKSGDKFHM
ncbi:MAG: hypothetical protein U9P90_02605 [Patescibacteria group bacterium]|nr:hypothetical protein [Patescibacteria group bacterium]